MKVMVGQFKTESNANIPLKNDLSRYDIAFNNECIRKLKVGDIFEEEGVEMIPAIYADTGPSYVLTRETYDYIESCFINTVKKHLNELDGIYLFLHGASEVDEIGSGDHRILREIRKIVGPYLPIFIACDPHGNLSKEYVEATTLIRSFRESPHTDSTATKRKVAKMLCDFLNDRQNIHSIYRKLPLILGGEQSVSTDEPVSSINKYMDKLEEDPRVRSVSWHVGYLRHDCAEAGCGIVVVPNTEKDCDYCEKVADDLAKYIWDKRHEFHYTGLTAKPDDALNMALAFDGKPVFITDSGDNTGSGAPGWNTYILSQVLAIKELKKSFLFANINDSECYANLASYNVNDKVHITLGKGYDEITKKLELDVIVKAKGVILGCSLHDTTKVFAKSVLIQIANTPIEVNVANSNYGMVEHHQFVNAGIDWDEYDVIVVKQGYIFPELKAKGKLSVMSLTMGATPQDTKNIDFKRIMRPMYPIDNI